MSIIRAGSEYGRGGEDSSKKKKEKIIDVGGSDFEILDDKLREILLRIEQAENSLGIKLEEQSDKAGRALFFIGKLRASSDSVIDFSDIRIEQLISRLQDIVTELEEEISKKTEVPSLDSLLQYARELKEMVSKKNGDKNDIERRLKEIMLYLSARAGKLEPHKIPKKFLGFKRDLNKLKSEIESLPEEDLKPKYDSAVSNMQVLENEINTIKQKYGDGSDEYKYFLEQYETAQNLFSELNRFFSNNEVGDFKSKSDELDSYLEEVFIKVDNLNKREERILSHQEAVRKFRILKNVVGRNAKTQGVKKLIQDADNALADAEDTNDTTEFQDKIQEFERLLGVILGRINGQTKRNYEDQIMRTLSPDQIRRVGEFEMEFTSLKAERDLRVFNPLIDSNITAMQQRIAEAKVRIDGKDFDSFLDTLRTDLDVLVADVNALKLKEIPITTEQTTDLENYKQKLVNLKSDLNLRVSTSALDAMILEVEHKVQQAEACTNGTSLEPVLDDLDNLLINLTTEVAELDLIVSSDQKLRVAEYDTNFTNLKTELALRVSTPAIDAKVADLEARVEAVRSRTNGKDFDGILDALKNDLDLVSAEIMALPLVGADVLPPPGPDLLSLTDAQKLKIKAIKRRFDDLDFQFAGDTLLPELIPEKEVLQDKIQQIESVTDASELDTLLDEIVREMSILFSKASLSGSKDYFKSLETRLKKKISTQEVDETFADLKEKIIKAEACTDPDQLKVLVKEIEDLLISDKFAKDFRALPDRKTERQTKYLSDVRVDFKNLRNDLPKKVGTEAVEEKIKEIEAKVTVAEAVEGKNELELLIKEIEDSVTSLYDELNDLPSPETMAEERLINYERDLTKLAEVFNNLYKDKKNVKLVSKYLGSYDAVVNIIYDAHNLPVTSEEESKAFLAATENVKIKFAEFIELVKNDPNKDVYQQFQEALQGLSPASEFLDSSVVVAPEEKGVLSRIGGWLGFGKKKPADTAVPPPPDKSRWERFKDAFKDKETRKFSRKVAYNTITSVLGIKTITDLGLAAFGKGDIAEWRKGTKESKVFVESIFDAYQKLLQSSERTKKGEPSALDEGVEVRLEDLKSIINDTKNISPEAKQQITERIWAISIKHQEDTDEAREERDAEVRRLLESYIHAKVSGAQIAKDGLNTLLTLGGGLFARGIVYGVGSVAERVQKARREHTYKNAGSINGESEFGFVAKDVTVRAAWETVRSLVGQGAKKGTSGTGKAMDFVKAWGTIARAVGIYGSLLSPHASPEEQIDAIINRVKSGQVLKIWEEPIHNASRALESYGRVVHAVANPIETLESIKDKITGGDQTDHGVLKTAMNDTVAQAHPEPIPVPIPVAPQPGGDSHTPGNAVEADQPITEVRTPGSEVHKFGVDNKLDKDFYPHLEKLVTGDKGFPELNNPESLQRILSASEGGSGVHSHHGFIKYEINTEVEVGAERQQVIFEEILNKGGSERAAKYLESLKFSRPQLKYIEDWVGKGKTSAKVDWKAFAAKYKDTAGSDHKMVEGLWRSMQGEETQDFANARLTGKGVDLHIHGHVYSWGVDEHGKPILSAVEGKDGYVTKDQMRVVGGRKIAIDKNADKQMWNNANKINEMQGDHPYREHTENNVPASEMTAEERAVLAEVEADKVHFAQAGAEHVEVLKRAEGVLDSKGHRHSVPIGEGLLGEQKTVKVKTLEIFRPSGQVVEAVSASTGDASAEGVATSTSAVDAVSAGANKVGESVEKSVKGVVRGASSVFESKSSGGGTPDVGKTAINTADSQAQNNQNSGEKLEGLSESMPADFEATYKSMGNSVVDDIKKSLTFTGDSRSFFDNKMDKLLNQNMDKLGKAVEAGTMTSADTLKLDALIKAANEKTLGNPAWEAHFKEAILMGNTDPELKLTLMDHINPENSPLLGNDSHALLVWDPDSKKDLVIYNKDLIFKVSQDGQSVDITTNDGAKVDSVKASTMLKEARKL